ncbi:ABC transporter permease [Candidatus Methylopumilus universalis]|uniref:ABC transporter permease n=1 Tax=Candidatus Methylopumilus universalis TaxID=2588536 RepID=UPI001120B96A|nr:ABC transporter permease [Candidatus Methylopumilus universalis]QDC96512.1 ABC transporter permease [Candidatus Methylopumilus universalis]
MNQKNHNLNPHEPKLGSFIALYKSLIKNRQLILHMTKRDVISRYRGSIIGLAWSFFNPIFMLSVYTIVFSLIFKAKWSVDEGENKIQFALILFTGMIVLNLFSEVLNRAPGLILSNVNYVKKVVFPLEILPVVSLCVALFHASVSFLVLIIAFVVFNGYFNLSTFLIPIIILPFLILLLGISWTLASLGVFIRDVGQTIGLLTTLLMFLSPVFYPISAVPEKLKPFILANPMTFIIEQLRLSVIWDKPINWTGLSIYLIIAILFLFVGFAWFQKTRKGFADVI